MHLQHNSSPFLPLALRFMTFWLGHVLKSKFWDSFWRRKWGVSNSLIQFKSALKIWPLLELLAKIRWVLACSCSQKFCHCSRAQILDKIPVWQTWETLGKTSRAMNVFENILPHFCWLLIEIDERCNSLRKAHAKVQIRIVLLLFDLQSLSGLLA